MNFVAQFVQISKTFQLSIPISSFAVLLQIWSALSLLFAYNQQPTQFHSAAFQVSAPP